MLGRTAKQSQSAALGFRRFSANSCVSAVILLMVPEEGVEPTRPCGHRILSPARLPVPPLRRRASMIGSAPKIFNPRNQKQALDETNQQQAPRGARSRPLRAAAHLDAALDSNRLSNFVLRLGAGLAVHRLCAWPGLRPGPTFGKCGRHGFGYQDLWIIAGSGSLVGGSIFSRLELTSVVCFVALRCVSA